MCDSNVKSVLHALVQLTDNFPRHEPQNVDLQQQLALVRAKFKQVRNLCLGWYLTASGLFISSIVTCSSPELLVDVSDNYSRGTDNLQCWQADSPISAECCFYAAIDE